MANTAASTLITRCLDNISRASAGTARSGATMDTQAMYCLNNTLMRTARAHNFKELYYLSTSVAGTSITVASTDSYTLPTDWSEILSIRIINGTGSVKLVFIPNRTWDKYAPYPAGDANGIPLYYTVLSNTTFNIYPRPDDAYVMPIRYIKSPALISSTATLIDYTPDKDDIIVAGMTRDAFNFLQLYEDAVAWGNIYKEELKAAIEGDEHPIDYEAVGRGFDSATDGIVRTDYYNNPLVFKNP